MYKNIFLVGVLLIILMGTNARSQDEVYPEVQEKVKEGLEYILSLRQYNPRDIVLVRKYNNETFYQVFDVFGDSLKCFAVSPTDINAREQIPEIINKSLVYSVLWIKKKKYQGVNLLQSDIQFDHLRSPFPNSILDSINNGIFEIEMKYAIRAHKQQLKNDYGNLKKVEAITFKEIISEIGCDPELISVNISYPISEKEFFTFVDVELGFVVTQEGKIENLFFFKVPNEKMAIAVEEGLNRFEDKLQEQGCFSGQDIYFKLTKTFFLF